jgi:hypothetical protein
MITVANMVPASRSDETFQDCEPNISVNPANPLEIAATAFSLDDPTSSTMASNLAPIYYSTDGGATWNTNNILPSSAGSHFPTYDVTVHYADGSENLYGGILNVPSSALQVLRTPSATTAMSQMMATSGDQPYVNASTVLSPIWSPDAGEERVYVGQNNGSATMISSLNAASAPPPDNFTVNSSIDTRGAFDNPSVRSALHPDGTMYIAFLSEVGTAPSGNGAYDVVVMRDNAWGSGAPPFHDLVDPMLGGFGSVVAQNTPIVFFGSLQADFGHDRLGSDLAIAVDPRNSRRVYIAWADGDTIDTYTIHVRYSSDGGAHWTTSDARTIVKAKNPGLAINSRGVVGFSYQRVTGATGSQRWETHFERSANNFLTFDDFVLANTSAESPTPDPLFGTYLGDYMGLQAVGKNFFGIFSASNYPDLANFPSGITYQRNVDWAAHQLLPTMGTTPVAVSIDPFFYMVTDEDVGADFYVRDWTDSAASGDNGAEPSTHPDFLSTCDVWNQASNTPPVFNANDQPVSSPASYGTGTAANNYAFARIRRNVGGIATSVTAHFMISEFGTGSNYTDAGTPDPSDPDVYIAGADPAVTFTASDLGPQVTPGYLWQLGPTASTHLCLAVEIDSPGDHYIAPGLTGHAPGWPTSDLAVIDDNNKAQRNLQVQPGMHLGLFTFYALAHNAATQTRDMVLQYGIPAGLEAHLREASLEVIDAYGKRQEQPFQSGGTVTLAGMEPGEHRWIGVTTRIAETAQAGIPVLFQEMEGNTVLNGFSLVAQPTSLEQTILANLDFHRIVFARMAAAFQLPEAQKESDAAQQLMRKQRFPTREDEEAIVIVEETVEDGRVSETVVVVEETQEQSTTTAEGTPAEVPPQTYVEFLRRHVSIIRQLVATLVAQQHAGDPFLVEQAVGTLEQALPGGNTTTITSLHCAILQKLDAFFTQLQLAQGNPADVLQTVIWQEELYAHLPHLRGEAFARKVVERSRQFIAANEARKRTNRDYSALLQELLPLFRATDSHLGGHLAAALVALENSPVSVRALQKAHHDYLLRVRSLAQ